MRFSILIFLFGNICIERILLMQVSFYQMLSAVIVQVEKHIH